MIGTIVNTVAVVVGSTLGLLLKRGIPDKYQKAFFQVIGLITIALGVTMIYNMPHVIWVIVSLVLGTWLGTWWNIEGGIVRMSEWMKRKLHIGSERFSDGLITAFLLFCVGSMTILGAVQEGTGVSSDLLYTKSLLDFFSSMILASTLGVGVLLAAIPLFLFQGTLTLLAMWASAYFTPDIIGGLAAVGGIMLIGLGCNILDIKKIPVANMLPALVIICLLIWIIT